MGLLILLTVWWTVSETVFSRTVWWLRGSLLTVVSLTAVSSLTVLSLTVSPLLTTFPTTSSIVISPTLLLLPTIRLLLLDLTGLLVLTGRAPFLTVLCDRATILDGLSTKLDSGEGAAGGADDSTASSSAPSFGIVESCRGRRLGMAIGWADGRLVEVVFVSLS
ncbi:hypothetical protein B0J18DRAFT_422228 [Chaetomium sp. MPI-SDFR-AT-0129]|nr:hypothetical protein B0J18DRAFT_422228 [Chaetomium sp. MPI-SDFR-AT-0129]